MRKVLVQMSIIWYGLVVLLLFKIKDKTEFEVYRIRFMHRTAGNLNVIFLCEILWIFVLDWSWMMAFGRIINALVVHTNNIKKIRFDPILFINGYSTFFSVYFFFIYIFRTWQTVFLSMYLSISLSCTLSLYIKIKRNKTKYVITKCIHSS